VADWGVERFGDWLLLAHQHFEYQLSHWNNEVRRFSEKHPARYLSHPKTKRLATLGPGSAKIILFC